MKGLFGVNQYAVGILVFGVSIMLTNTGGLVQAAYTMNETCRWLGNGYIGDPSDCQGWGLCKESQLIGKGKCSAGNLYDVNTAVCRRSDLVTCRTTSANICANVKEATFIGDPNNCNRYCYCEGGKSTCKNCPSTQIFDATNTQCVWGSQTNYQCPANSICRLVKNNAFVGDPDPTYCGNYVRCVEGSGPSTSCQPNFAFNPAQGSCVENYNPCSGNVVAPGSGLPPKTDATICSTYTGTAKTKFFVADKATCFGYYSCADETAVGQWGSCEFATHFDGTKEICNNPNNVVCQKDRCGNLNLEFVDNLGCTTYRYCQNGRVVASAISQSCPVGHANFDETRGGCVAADLPWPICTTPLRTLI